MIFTTLPNAPTFTILGVACVPTLMTPANNPSVPKSAANELLFEMVIPASLFADVISFALKSMAFVVKAVLIGFNDNICLAVVELLPYKNRCSLAEVFTL